MRRRRGRQQADLEARNNTRTSGHQLPSAIQIVEIRHKEPNLFILLFFLLATAFAEGSARAQRIFEFSGVDVGMLYVCAWDAHGPGPRGQPQVWVTTQVEGFAPYRTYRVDVRWRSPVILN